MSIKTAALALALALLWPVSAPAAEPVPHRGMTMAQVKARFGQPRQIDPAVGQPPITRWLYANYTVYFERNICLHTVMDHPRPTDPPATATGQAKPVTTSRNDNSGTSERQPDPRRHHTAAPASPGVAGQPASSPAPTSAETPRAQPKPAQPASDDDKPAYRSNVAPASSATRAERQQREASSHFRFNAASGRVEIVNDTKGHQQSGTPSSAATDSGTK